MTLNDYRREAARTAPRSMEAYPDVVQEAWLALPNEAAANALLRLHDTLILALGLAGEAGEVCDLLKKVHGHGKPYEPEKMLKELGDVLWYLANLADAHGFTLEQVAQANVDKLRARYPEGFSVAAAAAKRDEGIQDTANLPADKLVERVTFEVPFADPADVTEGWGANGSPSFDTVPPLVREEVTSPGRPVFR